jgi:hypothetical protein
MYSVIGDRTFSVNFRIDHVGGIRRDLVHQTYMRKIESPTSTRTNYNQVCAEGPLCLLKGSQVSVFLRPNLASDETVSIDWAGTRFEGYIIPNSEKLEIKC